MAHYSHRKSRRTRSSRGRRHHASAQGHIIGHVPPAGDGVLRYVTKTGAVYETAAHRGGSAKAYGNKKSSRKKSSRKSRRKR